MAERIGARQQRATALVTARLEKLGQAAALLRGLGAEQVWLFGSLATGTAHESSDVDLMVRGLPSGERTRAWLELEALFEASVDLIPEEIASGTFREAVLRHGRDITSVGGAPVTE